MANENLNPADPPCLLLFSAFLALEPFDSLLSLARVCGEGFVTERVQGFIWNHCISESLAMADADGKFHVPYLKNFLKKLISDAELNGCPVWDEIYEIYAHFMTSLKDGFVGKETARINKCISFIFPNECFQLSSCPKLRILLVPLQCSLNMLEGDTGCSVWPSSLYLSEFILFFPELFSNRSCFEVGSGVGLAGICLAHVKSSEACFSKIKRLSVFIFHGNLQQMNEQLQSFKPDIILGADVIYDPICLPHLVLVPGTLLNQKKTCSEKQNENRPVFLLECTDAISDNFNGAEQEKEDYDKGFEAFLGKTEPNCASGVVGSRKNPLALIASVI